MKNHTFILKDKTKANLSKFARERVEVILQDEQTKIYWIVLKEGYVFNGLLIDGKSCGYVAMPCQTVAEVKKWCSKDTIQEGTGFKNGDEALAEEYMKQQPLPRKQPQRRLKRKTMTASEFLTEALGLNNIY